MCSNYYWYVLHAKDVIILKARVTDKYHDYIIWREKWDLRIEYHYDGKQYNTTLSCNKDDYLLLSPGDSIEIKINKSRPKYVRHIQDGILTHNEVL